MITTFRDALKHATARLTAAGWERQTAFLEAALLLCSATGLERIKLLTSLDERLIEEYRHTYEAYLERRLAHEPLQYILGKQTFMSLDFAVTPDVLVPRGETELLVQEAIRFVQDEKWDQGTGPLSRCPAILDLCTGSGAIAVSLAYYLPGAFVTAADISPAALAVAQTNARTHHVFERMEFFCGDMFAPLPPVDYDVITCNPPYISAPEYAKLPADVRQEPRLALQGGPDGLDYYRLLGMQAGGFLRPGGRLFMEIGAEQAGAVTDIFKQNGFWNIRVLKDWNDHDRIITCVSF